jgi:hypothetical protein
MLKIKVEERFAELEGNDKLLRFQPHVMHHGIIKWTPDFIDENTGMYYEVVGARQSFYIHKNKGHFDFMLKYNIPLSIALYIRPVLGDGYTVVIPERFIIRQYTAQFELRTTQITKKGGGKMTHIQAFVDDELHKEIRKKAIDEDITVSDFVRDALVKKLEQSKVEKAEAQSGTDKLN